MFRDRFHAGLLLLSTAALTGCAGDGDDKSASGSSGPGPSPTSTSAVAISQKANVRFKRNERLRNDLMRTLDLDATEVCNELGKDSCTDVVHVVALGGVDPYGAGLFEPLPFTTTTAPMAIDRVVLSACSTRVDRDLAKPGGALIWGLDIDASGRLVSADPEAIGPVVDSLYRRAVQRPAEASEVSHLADLYQAVLDHGSDAPARDWAVASCFAVLTTMEFLFY